VVTVFDADKYSAELIGVDSEEFCEFLKKAETREMAIVYDYDEDNPVYVDIVFEDGLPLYYIITSP
jgi:hypothetical protein